MTAASNYHVAALGELVADLVPVADDAGQVCFAVKPGGAPGNVAVGVARLGGRAAMLGKVGNEALGRLVLATLVKHGVAAGGVVRAALGNTALAVVTVDASGDRDFVLYRAGCADSRYAPAEVDTGVVRAARVLHVGSLLLGQPSSAAAQRYALSIARDAGVLVSADVNLRPVLWRGPRAMHAAALEAAAAADVVKLSGEELAELSGQADIAGGIAKLWHPGLRLMAVTLGAAGALLATQHHHIQVPGFAVPVADTVGCGDAFMASLLTDLTATGFDAGSPDRLTWLARRACAAGAITAMGAGAMDSLPSAAARDAFLAARGG